MICEDRLYSIPCLQRKPLCDVVEWAETRHYLKSTSQLYSYAVTPYFREPCHYMSDLAHTSCVVIKTPAQCGKTLSIMNFIGWVTEFRPANTLLVLDSMKQGLKLSQNRIRPFIRDICGINNPSSTKAIKNPDQSNSVANLGLRSGANLFIASAKSASDSKSTPAKYVLLDEIDAYPDDINREGDPITLFTQRTKRYRGMVVMTSTPTSPDGNIVQNWKLGTAQTWGVICRDCGQWFPVPYDKIDFTTSTPTISCPHCGVVYSEKEIIELEHCYNSPTNLDPLKDDFGRIRRSFEVTAPLCHSFVSWDSLKRQEIAALSLGENSYKSFRNTVLGECYTPRDDVEIAIPDLMRLTTSDYGHDTLPQDVAFIVMGVDTHSTCLYVQTVGFSEDLKKLYGLRYDVLVGDPNDPDVWNQLYDLFNAQYTRIDSRILRPAFIFCDSGGHRTQAVYLQSLRCKRLMPIKGQVISNKRNQDPILGKQTKIHLNAGVKGRITLQLLGVNAAKDELANLETLTIAGDKRLFYPRGHGFNLDFFKGLLSEKKIGDRWIQPRGGHTDNEPLDTTIYAMAAAYYFRDRFYLKGKDPENLPQFMEKESMARKKKIDDENTNKNPNSSNSTPTTDSDFSGVSDTPTDDSSKSTTPKPTPALNFPHM